MRLLFDTRALLKLLADEPGGEHVRRLVEQVEAGSVEGMVSAITLTETWYLTARKDVAAAEQAVASIEESLELVPFEARIAIQAGRFKAAKPIPIADALIAATASVTGATVVTDDRDFEGLGVDVADESTICRRLKLV